MARPLEHAPDCPGPDINTVRGRLGDTLERCRACGRWGVKPPEAVTPERVEQAAAVVVAVVPAARYVCGLHSRPVNWRGTGCPDCVREHEAREATRAEDKRRREQARLARLEVFR
ncbi:MAG: hypothetical protein KDB60_07515 [Propionibacteriaceae bacterium]|nr:hypothetical protein [Propionibacteriaceae bacterium]